MSDAAGNEGFEDVLSSIRRLVSEDARDAGSDQAERTDPAQSKLLLTPALRVEDKGEAPAAAERPAPVEAPWQAPDTTLYQAAAQAHAQGSSSAPEPEQAASDLAASASKAPILLSQDDRAKELTLSAKITALEAAIERSRRDGPVRPQAPVQTTHTPDVTPDPVSVGSYHTIDDNAPTASEQDILTDEALPLDEESLRELITDIVREELQGAMGERITRNVRKLVRREIHRALTAQELE